MDVDDIRTELAVVSISAAAFFACKATPVATMPWRNARLETPEPSFTSATIVRIDSAEIHTQENTWAGPQCLPAGPGERNDDRLLERQVESQL